MPDRKEEESEFKVVDRRLFTAEGERRPDAPPPEPPAPEPPPPPQPTRSEESGPRGAGPRPVAPDGGAPAHGPHGPVQFQHLVMSLVTSAMLHLGMAARPGEAPPPPDFPAAQETIDLLSLLQQKTQGNLTPDEDELLTGSLAELRLAFVELSRRTGRIR